jgi:hypothetical protein
MRAMMWMLKWSKGSRFFVACGQSWNEGRISREGGRKEGCQGRKDGWIARMEGRKEGRKDTNE